MPGFGIMRASPERDAAELQDRRRPVRIQPGGEPSPDVGTNRTMHASVWVITSKTRDEM